MNSTQVKENNAEVLNSQKSKQWLIPKADIGEGKEKIVVLADIPGADQSTIDLTLEKNMLTITASVPETTPRDCELLYSEYPTGNYRRVFLLSNEIDRNNIEAVVKNGVLSLTLPVSKESLPKKITVTGG